jgi:hypothetical protein
MLENQRRMEELGLANGHAIAALLERPRTAAQSATKRQRPQGKDPLPGDLRRSTRACHCVLVDLPANALGGVLQ